MMGLATLEWRVSALAGHPVLYSEVVFDDVGKPIVYFFPAAFHHAPKPFLSCLAPQALLNFRIANAVPLSKDVYVSPKV